jgi:hypothetical protein
LGNDFFLISQFDLWVVPYNNSRTNETPHSAGFLSLAYDAVGNFGKQTSDWRWQDRQGIALPHELVSGLAATHEAEWAKRRRRDLSKASKAERKREARSARGERGSDAPILADLRHEVYSEHDVLRLVG